MFQVPNRCRVTKGPMASDDSYGNNGAFMIMGPNRVLLQCIASDGLGWEHVSVAPVKKKRVPNWDEMCFIKNVFWGPEDVVVQYHPAESEYVNVHPYVLHLWRPIGQEFPFPDSLLVG